MTTQSTFTDTREIHPFTHWWQKLPYSFCKGPTWLYPFTYSTFRLMTYHQGQFAVHYLALKRISTWRLHWALIEPSTCDLCMTTLPLSHKCASPLMRNLNEKAFFPLVLLLSMTVTIMFSFLYTFILYLLLPPKLCRLASVQASEWMRAHNCETTVSWSFNRLLKNRLVEEW